MDSNEVRRQWADRAGEYSPEYYAYYGPDETSESLRATFATHLDRDARILELGCSSGRHLAHLYRDGFENLAGIEINPDAFETMRETYPALADGGTFYCDAIERVVEGFADDRFDAVYSVETLQHLHPDAEWVFDELARITSDLLVTVENEGGDDGDDVNYVRDDFPLYYRDWDRVFTDRGFAQMAVEQGERDTVRTFRASDASGRRDDSTE